MSDLANYSAVAEIFSALTIILGAAFAAFQFVEYRRRRQAQVAADLCRRFAEPELARAVILIRRLPEGIGLEDLRALDPEYEEALQIFGMAIETMGLLIHENIASFQMIQQLTGGLVLSIWRKMEVWVRDIREKEDHPRFAEWVQWLAERVAEREQEMVPAFVAYKSWQSREK